MKTDDLRKLYLDFFKSKSHRVFASDSLIPADDPSLLFTGAGMNQFKPYFLGLKKDVKRAASCQKCLRTADLDRVGKTATHHTFFEMLGNFSFGDYFKEEAIAWGWEFVTKALRLSPSKLWVSVYEDDEEAFGIWKTKIGIQGSRIVKMGAGDNFWPSNAQKDGPNGPCGPCSEIYVGETPGKGVEIWNLVFTQFDRQGDGMLKNLPQKNIDTGMGLERTAAVLQGVDSNFDTDNFQKIRSELRTLMQSFGKSPEEVAHQNAAMDHARAAAFAIADGAFPSNEGRGYVVRKLIRLGSDHFEKSGTPYVRRTFHPLVDSIIAVYGAVYPQLRENGKNIFSIIENEENAYDESCERANRTRQGAMNGDEYAFMLYDTYGLPIDKIKEKFSRDGLTFNEERFFKYLDEQRNRSRKSSKIAGEIFQKNELLALAHEFPPTEFLGYEKLSSDAKLLCIIENNSKYMHLAAGREAALIFDKSPFYAESGGQIGDTGTITGNGAKAVVLDTQHIEKCIAHRVRLDEGVLDYGLIYKLTVDAERRLDIMKNHTATHLLHSALRKVLGDHVKQSGSLVAPDRLRFDFRHFSALDAKSMAAVEELVNAEVRKNIALDQKVMPREKATEAGAIAFFGEKYGDEVRVVSVGNFSKELCGGTHLHSTGEIGMFKIISEGSIQAGVRRVEAVTGRWAKELLQKQEEELKSIAKEFNTDKQGLSELIKKLQIKIGALNDRMRGSLNSKIREKINTEFQKPTELDYRIIILRMSGGDAESLKSANDYLKTLKISFVAFLAFYGGGKVSIGVSASEDLVKKGFDAVKIVKEISAVVDGNGGGRPNFAIGGGKDTQKIDEMMNFGEKTIKEAVSK